MWSNNNFCWTSSSPSSSSSSPLLPYQPPNVSLFSTFSVRVTRHGSAEFGPCSNRGRKSDSLSDKCDAQVAEKFFSDFVSDQKLCPKCRRALFCLHSIFRWKYFFAKFFFLAKIWIESAAKFAAAAVRKSLTYSRAGFDQETLNIF